MKQLANWIFYEDEKYYCFSCVEERLKEINHNKEFSDQIDYDSGEECGYYQDYANTNEEESCCKCGTPLFSKIDS